MLGGATGLRNTSLLFMMLLLGGAGGGGELDWKRALLVPVLCISLILACLPGALVANDWSDLLRLAQGMCASALVFVVGMRIGGHLAAFWAGMIAFIVGLLTLALISIWVPWLPYLPPSLVAFVNHWYPWYGVASSIAVVSFPLIFLMWAPGADRIRKWAMRSCIVAMLIILLSAQNRMSFVVITVVLAVCLAQQVACMERRSKLLLLGCFFLLIGAGGGKMLNKLPADTTNKAYSEMLVNTVRHDPRIAGWNFWIEKSEVMPWYGFGHGKRNLGQILSPAERGDPRLWDPALATHAHNMVFNFWLRGGYPALMAFLILWIGLLRPFYGQKDSRAAKAGLGIVIAMLLKNMTDDFFEAPLNLLFFFWVGALAAYVAREQEAMDST